MWVQLLHFPHSWQLLALSLRLPSFAKLMMADVACNFLPWWQAEWLHFSLWTKQFSVIKQPACFDSLARTSTEKKRLVQVAVMSHAVPTSKRLKKRLHYGSICQWGPRSAFDKHKLASHLAAPFPSLHMYLFQQLLFSCCLLLSDAVHWCASITGTFLTWWQYGERRMNRGGFVCGGDEISMLGTERQRRKQTKRDSRAKSNNANNNVKDSLFSLENTLQQFWALSVKELSTLSWLLGKTWMTGEYPSIT